jgi:hypothetical protein
MKWSSTEAENHAELAPAGKSYTRNVRCLVAAAQKWRISRQNDATTDFLRDN